MNKVKKRESIIAVTYLIISFISPIALACIFYSYTINGNKFKYLSALEGGIIITVLFFSTLIAFGFFIHHLLRVLKLDKKVLNKNLISWKYSDAEWKAFVYRETKRRFIDTLKLLKKMLKRYGVFGLVLFFIFFFAYKCNYFNIPTRAIAAVYLLLFFSPVLSLWNSIKVVYFFIENFRSSEEAILSKEFVFLGGEYHCLVANSANRVLYAGISSDNTLEIVYRTTHDWIDNKTVRILIPNGKTEEASRFIEEELKLEWKEEEREEQSR